MAAVSTDITVRVIARAGKFLGDDIGGAEVTIRDIHSGKLLAHGRTHGGSGPSSLMTTPITRNQPIPVADPPNNDACRFDATLDLETPRLIEISAYGPLAAPQSANRVTATTWISPGCSISPLGNQRIDGFVLEIPGLMVQVLHPPAHFLPAGPNPSQPIEIRANVTMMCGCPISTQPPWPDSDFDVVATVTSGGVTTPFKLDYDPKTPDRVPSQFFSNQWTPGAFGVYEIAVTAYQKSTGNTGAGFTTVNLQS
ncbi:MAG TPA: hypothetical protein VGL53_19530 [Bryobacteraceae bacterium]|jgi:hypothetical protein